MQFIEFYNVFLGEIDLPKKIVRTLGNAAFNGYDIANINKETLDFKK